MLNSRTIAKIPTANTRKVIRREYHNDFVCSPLFTSDRSSSLLLSSNNNTDAILIERHIKQQISSRHLQTRKPRKISPNSTLKFSQNLKYNPTKVNLTTTSKQQSVNSKAKFNIKYCCFKNQTRGSPRSTIKSTMMNHIYYLTAFLLTLCAISIVPISADRALSSALEKLKISPDIISIHDDLTTIKLELHGNNVKPGDPVPAKHFKDLNINKIHWDATFDDRHTVMLVDLDRKPGPNITQNIYNQFTSLNIPGNAIGAGQTIVAFEPPIVPCHPSTKHRILLLALKQEQNIDLKDVFYISASSGHSESRENFKLNDFVKRHRLELVAANILQAIGETNGVCSGSTTLHSIHSITTFLIAMVMLKTALGFFRGQTVLN